MSDQIKYLNVKGFKTLRKASMPFGKLNLFLGLNGMGKSSTLQVLLLLRQSFGPVHAFAGGSPVSFIRHAPEIYLNRDLIQLGLMADVLSRNSEEEEITIELGMQNGHELNLKLPYNPDTDVLMAESEVIKGGEPILLSSNLFLKDFQYLSAARKGPSSIWDMSYDEVENKRNLGIHGQFAPHFLLKYGSDVEFQVDRKLRHPNDDTPDLKNQVEAWMSTLSSPFRIKTEPIPGVAKLVLSYDFFGQGGLTDKYKPENVGFGITYCLPVVTSILSGKADKVQIIENPESHLHPKGQSMMGQLLARAAAVGQQLFIETHSDHVINGVRVAVKNGLISPDDVNIFFFKRDLDTKFKGSGDTLISRIFLDSEGELSDYPEGFLDEWDNQLMKLI